MKLRARTLAVIVVSGLFLLLLCASAQILALRGAFSPSLPASQAGGTAIEAGTSGHQIAGRVYLFGGPNAANPLVVVLHGDAPYRKPAYQYQFANEVAAAAPGTRVVALLRPGYADPFGARSDGDRGPFAAGENYTPGVIRDLASAIHDLKSRWNAQSLILVGHSGGAALTANIAALKPGLVQTEILVSCPCDVPAFRQHMAQLQRSPVWLLPVRSLSPIVTLDSMSPAVTVIAISGANDPIALPEYAEAYVRKAQSRGLSASIKLIPNQGHEILLNDAVIKEVAQAAQHHS